MYTLLTGSRGESIGLNEAETTCRNKYLVEAAGVEPASEKARRAKPTCVSSSGIFSDALKNRQKREPPSPIDLGTLATDRSRIPILQNDAR